MTMINSLPAAVYSKAEIDEKLEDLRVFLQDVLFQKLEVLESRYNNTNGEGLYKAFLREDILRIPTDSSFGGVDPIRRLAHKRSKKIKRQKAS